MLLKKITNLSLIAIAILILPLPKNLLSQQSAWQSSGPFLELTAEGITYFHSDPNIMLAGYNGVIYRSTDAGETWEYQCFYEGTIATIEMDPFLENVIYIGTSSGINKSEDYGKIWIQIGLSGARVNTIAIDKNNSDLIYAGAKGIFKSTDGGSNWDQTYWEEIGGVNEIIIDNNNSSTIYASIASKSDERDEGAFLKSTNSGDNWVRHHISGDWYPEAYGLVQSPGANGELYCISNAPGNNRDLWRSSDKGETWESIHVYYFATPVNAVVVDPQNTNTLYACGADITDPGIYKSTNRGNNWTNVNNEITGSRLIINPDDSRLSIVNYNDGILQSKSGGSFWKACPVNSYITDIAIHPNDDDTLFVAIAGERLFKSNDGNNSWIREGSSSLNDKVVAFYSGDSKFVGAAGGKYFHKSTDGGDYFSNHYYSFMSCSESPCKSYPEEILFKQDDDDRIIVGTSGDDGVLAMSTNGGTEWVYIEFSTSAFVFDPTNSNNIYAGTKDDGGVFKIEGVWGTSPNIINLTPAQGIGNVNDIAVNEDSKLLIAAADGLWHWNGSSWNKFSGLPNDNITAVILDKNENPNVLYVGTESNGIYASPNQGILWTKFGEGLDSLSITKLAISETNSKRLYAGTKKGGLWVTDLLVGLSDELVDIPTKFALYQNYPNPFNPSTTIKYSVANVEAGYIPSVQLKVYDILGREIITLVNKEQPQGNYEIEFDGIDLTSGIYLYRLQVGDFVETRKMIVLK